MRKTKNTKPTQKELKTRFSIDYVFHIISIGTMAMSDLLLRIWEGPSVAYFSGEKFNNSQIRYKIAFKTHIRISPHVPCRHFTPPPIYLIL